MLALVYMWTLTSLSYQFAILNTGSAESTGVNSSVYVFTRILELYLRDSKLYTIYKKKGRKKKKDFHVLKTLRSKTLMDKYLYHRKYRYTSHHKK